MPQTNSLTTALSSLNTAFTKTCPTCGSWTFVVVRVQLSCWGYTTLLAVGLCSCRLCEYSETLPVGWRVLIGTTRLFCWHCLDTSRAAIPSAQPHPTLERWDYLQNCSHLLPIYFLSPYLPNTEDLSTVQSWYVGHRTRRMYTPALAAELNIPYYLLKKKDIYIYFSSLHIFYGGSSQVIAISPPQLPFFFFIFRYIFWMLPKDRFHYAKHLSTCILSYNSIAPTFHLIGRLFRSLSLAQLFY